MSSAKLEFIEQALERRQNQQRLRQLRTRNTNHLCFDSNDYLGLSQHPQLKARASAALSKLGCGATASRLVSGNLALHEQVEQHLAHVLGRQAALLLNTGYQANLSLIPALADRHCELFIDRLSHHSLLQGSRLSGARLRRFAHNDLAHLSALMAKSEAKRKLVVTESLFSMDGDKADIAELSELCAKHDALFYLDDAHGFGMQDTLALAGPDIHVVTFGKAAGCFGAAVGCSARLKEYFINSAGGLIYSTALPPAALGAIGAALDLLPQQVEARKKLCRRAEHLRCHLRAQGWDTGNSCSHIIPLIVGSDADAIALSSRLAQFGILCSAIRPPTVPEGQARLRIVLNCNHSDADCQRLLKLLASPSSHGLSKGMQAHV